MKNLWDKIGMVISVTCLIHCLFTPIVVLFFPFFSSGDNPLFHQIFFIMVLISAFMAFYPHRKTQHAKKILGLGISSVSLIGLSIFVVYPLWGHEAEVVLTIIGSSVLVYAHYKNMKICRGLKHRHL